MKNPLCGFFFPFSQKKTLSEFRLGETALFSCFHVEKLKLTTAAE